MDDSMSMGTTRSFMVYLMVASFIAVAATFFISAPKVPHDHIFLSHTASVRVWPELELSWRSILATVIGFLGSAFGTVGGVGGGGIFVPMLNLVVGFDTKSAAALSKCMIMGASASSVWYNLRVSHPSKEVPIIDYDLSLLFQPMLMLGITIGVELSIVFPYWLITILIIILFLGTSSRSFFKAIQMWKEETLIKMDIEKQEQAKCKANDQDVAIGSEYEPLLPPPEKSSLEILLFNIRWKRIIVLMLVWCSFLFLQIIKNNASDCSTLYWTVNILQFPVALSVFGWEAAKLWKESHQRRLHGNWECVCEASIEWTPLQLLFCASAGLLGGTVGGLLGSGGGFILGPLLLEIGVIPQVASATATFVMMFSSSLSVIEFYFLKRFPIPYALYLTSVSIMAGFWGQFFIRKLVKWLGRASIIIFILSAVIFASALTMGVVGGEKSIQMINRHEYMGFLGFCDR
ncbi:Transmembrane protein TauE-like protein [Dioscorea alata]|uniref:Transmembrane protein TauE-like protein n=2 Tax=Dioscorea alata TaxID=55571 RepID=A0ACB7WNR3_DIOAL|nr:Transmembrane protein TauE-like protein [Dioscorea alata]KAH7689809.1 Transmembrane protein TauE-like protein [Dioscorea alata]